MIPEDFLAVVPWLEVEKLAMCAGIFAFASFVLLVLYRVIFALLRRASKLTKNDLDDRIVEQMRGPAKVLALIAAFFIAVNLVYPGASVVGITINQVVVVLLILDGAFAVDRALTTVLKWYGEEVAPKTASKMDEELLPLVRKLSRIFVYVIALMVAASTLGIEISPLLTGLGIAGLAVALALQDSLGNFFAGLNISLDRPIRPGDYISLDNGVSGEVEDIGWRTTKIRTWDGNVVYVPNQKLAQSIVTNFYAPNEEYLANFIIGVDYDSDVDEVLETLTEALKRVQERNPLVVKDYPVKVRFEGFGEHELRFKCFIKVKNYRCRFDVMADAYREIFYLFKERGISIPFPVRTIYFYDKTSELKANKTEKAAKAKKKRGKK